MKKFMFILGIVVLSAVIFAGGLFLGTQHDVMNTIVTSSILGDDISKSSTILVVLHYLEEGKTDEAKTFLNIQLDSAIIGMNAVLPYCPAGDSTRATKKLLIRIAKHRQEHPSQRDSSLVDEEIQSIMNNALTEEN